MELYRIGKVVSTGKSYIILESRYSGEIVYVVDAKLFEVNKVQKVYIFNYKNDYYSALYGFVNFKERTLFENLINVNNIGPKIALNLLRQGVDNLIRLIVNNQIEELTQIPLLGIKGAKQIIFDLREKYMHYLHKEQFGNNVNIANNQTPINKILKSEKQKINDQNCDEVREPLKILGFHHDQINYAIKNLSWHQSLEVMIENAIKLISNVKFNQNQ